MSDNCVNLGTLKEKLCCEGVNSSQVDEQVYNPNQGK
jgi:hypothetical protein